MRQVTLTNLLTMLKAEVGDNGVGNTTRDAQLTTLLSNKQKWLAAEYDWPFLEHRWNLAVSPGNRYLSFPTVDEDPQTIAINFERPVRTDVYYNNKWQDVDYGVNNDDFNYINSDGVNLTPPPEVLDPIQRWRFDDEGKCEIWPIPTVAQTLRFTGQRTLNPLATGSDTADLDDMLLVYFAAGEILTREKQADAPLKLQLAQERMRKIRAQYPQRERTYVLGRQRDKKMRKEQTVVPLVVIHG